MDVRTSFVIAIGILLFTMYYLEKEMDREQIYWLFAGLSVVTGLGTVYYVAKKSPSFEFLITLTVLFVIIAILYYEGEGDEGKAATIKKEKAVATKKAVKKKGKRKKK